jgi:hypothetical protein
MNKIIEVALTGKFGAEAVSSLMEVIVATPNPEMATEILLGIYEEPVVPEMANETKTLVSVNHWTNMVTYSEQVDVTKHIYIHKEADRSLINIDNYEEFVLPYSHNDSVGYSLATGERKTVEKETHLTTWLDWYHMSLKAHTVQAKELAV